MSGSAGLDAFTLAFQISPIALVGGLAQNIPGQMLPIVALTQAADFTLGLLSGTSSPTNLLGYFAHFRPMPGGTLIDFQIANYPFANQAVAANAIIAQPLQVSMLMVCPAEGDLGYAAKFATMNGLRTSLQQHSSSGGTYTLITPSSIRPNGILLGLRDASNAESKQPENAWQWDFTFPLLTLQAAQQVQNSLMSKITGGTAINGTPAWSGLSAPTSATGANSIVGPSVIPGAAISPAGGVSPGDAVLDL